MAKSPGSLVDGEISYHNPSRTDPKHPNQWFMDGTEAEFFPNKKQAVEVSHANSFSALPNSSISSWGNSSGFRSVASQYSERLFDHETLRTVCSSDRNLPSFGTGNINMEKQEADDTFGNDSSFWSSISHPLEYPRSALSYGGIRKVKVSQVKDGENFMSVSREHAYSSGDHSTISNAPDYRKADDSSIAMGLSFHRKHNNMISTSENFDREDSNVILMGQPYNKGGNSEIPMGLTYQENSGSLSIGQSVTMHDSSITTMKQPFPIEDENSMGALNGNNSNRSVCQVFSKEHSNATTTTGKTFSQEFSNALLMESAYDKSDGNTISIAKVDNGCLSIGHSFSKGESSIISFGGLHDDDNINSSGRLICSYDFLMGQPSFQRSEKQSEKGLAELSNDPLASALHLTASGETASKKKVEHKSTKRVAPSNFPSNVRSLLSTGILDGVPVKYVAWSQEKELHGIIKGSTYLCGCQSCNFSKPVNAYEFERHANCKTKHPNNHIYFENGKTIYGIVQELRNTPQNLLFEVIQTITGSPIDQKHFRLWKESFLAATRELQRIYGKEEVKIFS